MKIQSYLLYLDLRYKSPKQRIRKTARGYGSIFTNVPMQSNNEFATNANENEAPLMRVELNDEGRQVVSARELYAFLEIGTRFNDWIKRRIQEYDFIENKDFIAVTQNRVTAQGNLNEYTDYLLPIQVAKELSMVEKNIKGRQARKYFIFCEENLHNLALTFLTRLEHRDYSIKLDNNFLKARKYLRYLKRLFTQLLADQQADKQHIALLEATLLTFETRLVAIENSQTHEIQRLTEIEVTTANLMHVFGIDADCFVYVFFNPQTNLHKMGRSKAVGKRKQHFKTVAKELILVMAIPTRNQTEAVKLEQALQQRFLNKLKYGEWYFFEAAELDYLRGLQLLSQAQLASQITE